MIMLYVIYAGTEGILMNPTVLQIRTSTDPASGEYRIYTLTLDSKALFNLKSSGTRDLLQHRDEDLVVMLINLGAALNNIISEAGDFVPAVQVIDSGTDRPRVHAYYKDNKLQDLQPDHAAVQIFNPATGQLMRKLHFQNDQLHDPSPGKPAVVYVNPDTEIVVFAESFFHGESDHVLEDSELVCLNRPRIEANYLINRFRLQKVFVL